MANTSDSFPAMASTPRGTSAQLDDVIVLLSKICESRNARGQVFKSFNKAIADLVSTVFSPADVTDFFTKIHDRLLKYDTVFRISAYRAIRYLLKSSEHIVLFYQEGIDLIVVESLEREHESPHERMQALKLIRKCTDVSPSTISLAFVRSVVAVASDRDDKFRRVCIDTLRDISFRNPAISSFCGGFRVLFDALLQPDCFEIIDSIIATMLFLYDSTDTRPFVDFESNLSGLISVFTDFDSSYADNEQRLRSARVALVTLTRSWGGLHLLSQGDKGLRVLTRLLCDSKIAPEVQDVVLDIFAEAMEPVVSRTNPYSKPEKLAGIRKLSTKHLHSKGDSSSRRAKKSDELSRSNSGSDRKSPSPVFDMSNGDASGRNPSIGSSPAQTRPRGLSIDDDDDEEDFDDDIDFAGSGSGDDHAGEDTAATISSSPRASPRGRSEMSQYVIARNTSLSAFLSPEAAANLTVDSDTAAKNSLFDMTKQGHRRGIPEISDSVAKAVQSSSDAKAPGSVFSEGALVPLGTMLQGSVYGFKERRISKDDADVKSRADPLYNLMDSYGIVLCAALLKAKLFQALCTLGTIGTAAISEKSRKILVNFLGIISRLFPDQICAQLLQDPSLIEFASTFASLKLSDRALKASQLLLSVSNTFSLARGRGGFTAPSIMAKVASTSSSQTSDPEVIDLSTQIQRDISLGTLAIGGKAQNAFPMPTSGYGASSIIASRLREHRVTRAASDIVDEIAHTSFSRVFSRSLLSLAAAPSAPRNRAMSDNVGVHRNSLVSFFMGDSNTSQGAKPSAKSSPSAEPLEVTMQSQTREDLIYEIKVIATPILDRADFARQMELSRVLGKEGKEPFKWDWPMVNDMLEFCIRTPERLTEALKTKWIKRLSGFYRCSSDDKGYFANLDWYPSNLFFLESACNLYSLLVDQSNGASVGMSFLGTDRRGMLFAEILNEVESLIMVASRTANLLPVLSVPYPASGPIGASAAATGVISSRSVFRPYGCSQLMSREYFTLLGRLCVTQSGRQLVESNKVNHHLSTLAQHPCLDYLTRTALTAICFSDEGFISRSMLQIIPASPRSSFAIKLYAHTIQHALLRARDPEANKWMIETISAQLVYENIPMSSAIRVLEAFVQDCGYLKHLAAASPSHILTVPGSDNVLIRLLSIPEGLAYMSKLKWVAPNIKRWMQTECQTYASRVNEVMFDALCIKHRSIALNRGKDATPITVACRPYCLHPSAPRRYSWYPDGGVDTEGLLRAPWNIEVRIGTQPAGQGVSIGSMPPEYIRIDSYFDASELPSAPSGDVSSDTLRIARVRGVVIDDRGLPSAVAIAPDRILSTCLLIGVCPVYRDGRVYSNPPSSSAGGNGAPTNGASVAAAMDTKFSSASNMATQRRRYVRNGDNTGIFFNMEAQTGTIAESVDPPLTYQTEHLQDWTYCKPAQRQSVAQQKELGGGCFSVEIAGEPVVWIFSRYPPGTEKVPEVERSSVSGSQNGAVVYLVEVHFLLRLVTGDPTMAPIPRHMFGELARTMAGCNLLVEQGVISALLTDARPDVRSPSPIESRDSIFDDDDDEDKNEGANDADNAPLSMDEGFEGALSMMPDPNNESVNFDTFGDEPQRLKAAIWALGHIASTDHGCEIVLAQDPSFISWLIHIVTSSPSFSLRNICFAALGLISRTEKANHILAMHEWDSAPNASCAAAMPIDLSALFRKGPNDVIRNDKYVLPCDAVHEATGVPRRSYLRSLLEPHDSKNTELYCDVMECIARLPGHILFRDNWSKLSQLKNRRADLFSERSLYLSVHKLLAHFSFTLHVRRQIAELFSPAARLKVAS